MMLLRVKLNRILSRRRLYCTIGLQDVNINSLNQKIVNKNYTNELESLHSYDRYTSDTIDDKFKQNNDDFISKLQICEIVSEVCELFEQKRNKLCVRELLLMLSRIIQINKINLYSKNIDLEGNIDFVDEYDFKKLIKKVDYFPNNEFCLLSLNSLRSINIKKLDRRVCDMIIELVNKFSNLSNLEILYLNRMCKYLKGYHRKLILNASEERIGPQLNQMEPVDLIRTGMAIASVTDNVDFVKIYIVQLFKKLDLFDKEEKKLIFEIMGNSNKCSTIFLKYFAEYLSRKENIGMVFNGNSNSNTNEDNNTNINNIKEKDTSNNDNTHDTDNNSNTISNRNEECVSDNKFNETDYIRFLTVYGRNPKCISKQLFKYFLAKCLVIDLNQLNLNNVLDLVWVSNKFNNLDLFLPRVMCLLSEKINEIGPNSLAMLIWAYSNSNINDIRFHQTLEQAAIDNSQELTAKNISLCAYGLSLKMYDGWEPRFLIHIQDEIISNISHFNGLDLSMLSSAYSRSLCGSNLLHQCIQESVVNYVEELPADCISKLLYSYARISGKQSLFTTFMFSFLERMHQFPIHEFVQVLWSYLVMNFYEHMFWKTCLEVVFNNFNVIIEDSRCYLIYPVLKILTQLNIVPNNPESTRLMNHTRKYFWNSQKPNPNSKIVSDAIESIDGVESVSNDHNLDGFMIDVYFNYNQQDCALIIYNNRNTFNHTPIGDFKIKELFLTNKGCKIVRILEDVWMSLDNESRIQIIKSQL